MASPNATFTEMVTTTLREHPSMLADNVSNHNALYRRLKEKGGITKSLDGGYEIVEPLMYAENSTYQRYSGYDTLNVAASDVLTAAKYDWKQASVHVTASGLELRKNSGRNQLIALKKARMDVAKITAANNMSTDLYSDGSLANQIGGLAHLIQNDGTGNVGGINSSTYTWWKNQFKEMQGTNNTTTIKEDMHTLWLSTVRGKDKPDLIVSTHDFYTAYWESLTDIQRYSNKDNPDTFVELKFQGADVIFDDDSSNFTTTGEKMYFLNTNYLKLRYHPDANWSPMEDKISINQDAVVIPLLWMGQLTTSNRARQGVLIDAT